MLRLTQLVEADALKDEFVALISHDLRTPLTSIMGYVELALDDELEPPLDEERRGYLEVVSRSSHRLLRLVDDLLFVARLQAGRLDLDAHELDLREIARQSARRGAARAPRQGHRPRLRRRRRRCEVEADKGRMFQLLDNLVSNAIKFTPDGGRVEVACRSERPRGARGARHRHRPRPAEEAPRVFERFFRAERCVEGQVPGHRASGSSSRRRSPRRTAARSRAAPRDGGGAVFRVELPARVRRCIAA